MSFDRGKSWEAYFKKTWAEQFPNTFIFRLKDQVSEFKEVSKNPCDFICFPGDKLFLFELKAHKGASVPFSAIPQYERLLEFDGLKNVVAGVLVWLYEKDSVFFVPISTMKKMVQDDEKSVGLRHFDKYDIIELPGEKQRVFVKPDYSTLINL